MADAAQRAELDARFKMAAVVMRRRWDAYNEAHGIEVDYDTLSADYPYDSSDDDAGDDGWEEGWDEDCGVDDVAGRNRWT